MQNVLYIIVGLLIGFVGTIFLVRYRNRDTFYSVTFGGLISDSEVGETTPSSDSSGRSAAFDGFRLSDNPLRSVESGVNFSRRRQVSTGTAAQLAGRNFKLL